MKKHGKNRKPKRKKVPHQALKINDESQLKAALAKDPDGFQNRYKLAHFYADRNDAKKAFEVGEPLKDSVTSDNLNDFLNVHRLLVFSAIYSELYDEAREFALKGVEYCPDGLDFYYAATIIIAKLNDYKEARKYAEEYLRLWSGKEHKQGCWDKTFGLRHQIMSVLGASLNESSDYKAAEKILYEAIEDNEKYESSYINLAVLLKSQKRFDDALKVLKLGLKNCPESVRLRKMTDWSGKRTTISACMIVKNEEELLPRCLKSICDVVDEIILVDTGSEDKTIEIAEQFGCKIYHYPWQGDFSSARNESMKYATKDWILIIDADEELPAEEVPQIRVITNQQEFDVISISVINKSLETDNVTSFLPSIRLIKRNLGLQYYGIVHNRLDIPDTITPLRSEVKLYHYGYDISRDKLDKKLERTRKLLKNQLKDNPDDVYANFNMAQLLRGYENSASPEISNQIVEHAGRVLNNPDSKLPMYFSHRMMAFHQKAIGLCALQRFDEAEECCNEAILGKPDYLDPILTLGDIYNYLQKFDEARKQYNKYLELQKTYEAGAEVDNIILHNLEARHKAWFGIGLIEEKLGDNEKAIFAYEKVLKHKEPYLDTYHRLGGLYLSNNMLEEAKGIFTKELEVDENSSVAYYGLGCIRFRHNEIGEALELVSKSLEIEPDQANRIIFYGRLLIDSGQIDKGKREIIKAVGLAFNGSEVIYAAADLMYEIGEFGLAIEYYNKTLEMLPNHINALNNLGNSYFKIGQNENACAIYEQVIEKNPEFCIAYRNLGLARQKAGHFREALQTLIEYSRYSTQDEEIYKVIGGLYFKINQYNESLQCYERYLSKYPQDYQSLLSLADIYKILGHLDSARMGYERVLQINPSYKLAEERLDSFKMPEAVK